MSIPVEEGKIGEEVFPVKIVGLLEKVDEVDRGEVVPVFVNVICEPVVRGLFEHVSGLKQFFHLTILSGIG